MGEATMVATEATTLARGRLRLSLDTLVLAMAMVLEATMVVTEATTLARGRLRLSLDTLALAMAMGLEVTMVVTEATTLARGRLRLMLVCMPTTPLCMPPAMLSLPMLDTGGASKLSSRLNKRFQFE